MIILIILCPFARSSCILVPCSTRRRTAEKKKKDFERCQNRGQWIPDGPTTTVRPSRLLAAIRRRPETGLAGKPPGCAIPLSVGVRCVCGRQASQASKLGEQVRGAEKGVKKKKGRDHFSLFSCRFHRQSRISVVPFLFFPRSTVWLCFSCSSTQRLGLPDWEKNAGFNPTTVFGSTIHPISTPSR